jgi:hypothetical protein
MVCEAFASVLRAARQDLNGRFVTARHAFPTLDGEAFAEFLKNTVDPLVAAVDVVRPECTAPVTFAAYDAALELLGQNLAGPKARNRHINEGWRQLLPAAAPHVAAAPARVISALSNALHHLETTPGARPEWWIAAMGAFAPACGDPNIFLRLGQVFAWRAGLAHFREGALDVARTLEPSLGLSAVGAAHGHGHGWPDVVDRLARDPWFDPTASPGDSQDGAIGLRLLGTVGAFRGYGGLFSDPPSVLATDGRILVSSGGECWALFADAFGATFHRAGIDEFTTAWGRKDPLPGIRISGHTITRGNSSLDLESLGSISSAAATPHTLAVTSPITHGVTLIALS